MLRRGESASELGSSAFRYRHVASRSRIGVLHMSYLEWMLWLMAAGAFNGIYARRASLAGHSGWAFCLAFWAAGCWALAAVCLAIYLVDPHAVPPIS